ncbi:DUF916 domain-containing protein [Patescibacteria group bacterium]|nr:DUF916 domain-containing protein [Patescibacteria group bacterium]
MKKICPSSIINTLILSLFFLFSFFNQAQASSSMSLTATPVRLGDDFSISLAPGEKKQVQIKVRNGSTDQVVLESQAADFVVAEDGSTPIVISAEEADLRWSLATWLTLAPAEHTLANEEVAIVNVLIEVPKDALPGGHYAMIYHRPINSNPVVDSGAGISQRVGTLLYVIVTGPINEEAYITSFNWPKFLENGPVDFSLDINNESDVHINTKPILKIYNLFGKEIESIELEAKNIFPKSNRSFSGTWNKVWGLGYYKAVVESAYGSQGGVMVASAGLYLIPVKIILLTLVVILIGIILFISVKKRKEASKEINPVASTTDLETNNEEPKNPQQEN